MPEHKILTIKKASLNLEDKVFPGAIQNANITVTEAEITWPAIDGVLHANEEAQHVLNIDFGQDFSSEDTLFMYLWNNTGKKVLFKLEPDPDTNNGAVVPALISGTVVLKRPSQIGGARGVATATAALRVEGDVLLQPQRPAGGNE